MRNSSRSHPLVIIAVFVVFPLVALLVSSWADVAIEVLTLSAADKALHAHLRSLTRHDPITYWTMVLLQSSIVAFLIWYAFPIAKAARALRAGAEPAEKAKRRLLNAPVIAERLTVRSENFVLNGKPYGTRGGISKS